MAPTLDEQREIPVDPFKDLKLQRPTGDVVTVRALGTGLKHPAIDFTHESHTGTRRKTEVVGFYGNEFEQLMAYLQEVKQHWEVVNGS